VGSQRKDLGERRHDQRDGYAQRTLVGVRVKFSQAELSEKEHLREFLKFVENSARKSQSEKSLRDATQELDFPL